MTGVDLKLSHYLVVARLHWRAAADSGLPINDGDGFRVHFVYVNVTKMLARLRPVSNPHLLQI